MKRTDDTSSRHPLRDTWRALVNVAQIPEGGLRREIEADERIRAAIAEIAGLRDVSSARAAFDLSHMSGGRVQLSTGTLYGALQRLLDQGWIERIEEDEAPRDRRTYRLTSRGRRNIQMELERMRHLTKLAGLRIASKEA